MTKKREVESEATRQASAELQAIAEELRGLRRRLVATAKRLKAAASSGAVVDTTTDGKGLTVERWSGESIDPAPLDGGGTSVLEAIDEALERIGWAADADGTRAVIRKWAEDDRRHAARHAAKN
jgi:hypothetical protein